MRCRSVTFVDVEVGSIRHFDVRRRPASDAYGRHKYVLTNEISDLSHEYSSILIDRLIDY